MRAREFIMKDAYSFHSNQKCLDNTYDIYKSAYTNIFKKLMLDFIIVDADSGNIGGNQSNEFHVIADTGEDDLLLDKSLNGMNIEIAKIKYSEDNLDKIIEKSGLTHKKGIEVGHIFKLGQKYSESMKAKITLQDSTMANIFMGCYGIGVTRIVAAAIEQNYDDHGIIWPQSLSPFQVALIEIDGTKNEKVKIYSQGIYDKLRTLNIDIIYDDRDLKMGSKIKDWELLGIPHMIIIGKKEAENNNIIYKSRLSQDKKECTVDKIIEIISKS